MFSLSVDFGLVWLTFGLIVCESAKGSCAFKSNCYRKTCKGIEYDTREAVCCENNLHPGAGLSCCGNQSFNSAEATCCKAELRQEVKANVTEGLSQSVSCCCSLKAYNPLNEICCQSTVKDKPTANAQCCGEDAFDKDTQLCCGLGDNKKILLRISDRHQCCGHDQFDRVTQHCCLKDGSLVIHSINSSNCREESVSALCGQKTYDERNELCCESSLVAKPTPASKCCGNETYDEDNQLCCGLNEKKILKRKSSNHECCGQKGQYDKMTQRCCLVDNALKIQPINSTCSEELSMSALCGQKTYDERNELCCESSLVAKPTPASKCCGNETYDEDNQLCCGLNVKKILKRKSSNHECCGQKGQYNKMTQRCCLVCNNSPETHNILCGSSCFSGTGYLCCERDKTQPSGQGNIDPTCSHVCCAGCISEWKSLDQGCGATQNSLVQHKVLCFDLETDRKDGEECSDISVPYLQSKGTICCNKFHGSPGQHSCGTELYNPHREICCNGHRHSKEENKRCCGVQAYNIKNKQKKCCAGTLYHLSSEISAHEAQCCGSSLQKSSDICCSNEHKEVLYPAKTGFSCCGHLYYNTSLWSCCAGKLSPVHKPGQRHGRSIKKPRLVSMSNLNEEDLCKEMLIGIVDSVSLHSIVFSSVFKIFGRNATVIHLPSTRVLRAPDHCNSPKLILGKTCFFDQVNVFTDFTHDSLHQSLHFIISKCYRP
ncbi:uncharacterized protein [Labrus bergylta]|uniref:uncharacterized protein n=1 Tax=Labrus bergylta TaxID=56723 RepID=UPI0033142FCB